MSFDYVDKYFTDEGFDFPTLIGDDFIAPIRLLLEHDHFVAATKLLMSFIDSVGYVEYGEAVQNPFREWLDTYVDLAPIGVTSEELWEQRNSLLHMGNLDSRKVVKGKVKRLILYLGQLPPGIPQENELSKFYNLRDLLLAVIAGCEPWFNTYNTHRGKFRDFFERYDLIVSDARMGNVIYDDEVGG